MVDQGVDQSPIFDTGTRMDDQTRGFIEDDDMFVGVDDIERDIFRKKKAPPVRLPAFDLDYIALLQLMGRLGPGVVQTDLLVGDELLDLGPAQVRKMGGKKDVQPPAGSV
jgi:hypothetical protein